MLTGPQHTLTLRGKLRFSYLFITLVMAASKALEPCAQLEFQSTVDPFL